MYYYPYMNYGANIPKRGLFSSLKRINFGNILNNTQRTLSIINQAIPIFYQVKPLWNNTKTVFKIMNAMSDNKETPKVNNSIRTNYNNQIKKDELPVNTKENQPTFFL